jgi:DNA repair ATPase RecN
MNETNTKTFLKMLPEAGRINEIAKMLSDSKISNSALETARELLNN